MGSGQWRTHQAEFLITYNKAISGDDVSFLKGYLTGTKMLWENQMVTCKRIRLDSSLTPLTKINSKQIKTQM